ncbi:Alpha/Beta hydrolase protein [Pseudomassariella vexata]|uniref:Kynurenine formamidase n=1 Tax=Pseudomassariella vexata TaxID=1141098 RepID=A0A1Y2EJS2_9PEZI|nr:Alpha/Beta hydrolase protein [Pseudomassariella vexata]ORY71809.1 Alpha/Beta hydrolase protein [Pseudomassariella vexata]
MASSLKHEVYHYGTDSILQRLGIWHLDTTVNQISISKYWVIYIHGGVWRDPLISYDTFIPTIDRLLSPEKASSSPSSVTAFASIDYRLSPHPDFPQDPSTTPPKEYRNAFHPDHIHDVWSALRFLQTRYGFGGNYVLVGHSAGAALALQLLMGSVALKGAAAPTDVELPAAIVGMEGVYDLKGLMGRFGPGYGDLFRGAFGGEENWDEVSPMKFKGGFGCKLVALGWSTEDELIDEAEIDGMAKVLERDGVKTLVLKDLKGTHDGTYKDGRPFADVILRTLEELGH